MHRESQLRELGKVFADLSTDYVLRGTDKLHIQDQKDLRIVVGQPRQYLHHRQSLSQSKASLGGTCPVIVSAVTFDVYRWDFGLLVHAAII